MNLELQCKMCLNETYSRVQVGKNLSDMFHIRNGLKQGDAISPLLFNCGSDYAIRRVQVNRDGLQLNGTRQLMVDADDFNILGRSIHTVKENGEALVVVSMETGQEVKADICMYCTWSCLNIRMQDEITD